MEGSEVITERLSLEEWNLKWLQADLEYSLARHCWHYCLVDVRYPWIAFGTPSIIDGQWRIAE
jgi:hypothetical protein